jgi:hypothetical protein
MLGSGHQPRAWIVGNTRLGPLLEGGDQSILREVFGEADIAHDAGQSGDEADRLHAPDGIDRGMGVGRGHLSCDDNIFAGSKQEAGIRCLKMLGLGSYGFANPKT